MHVFIGYIQPHCYSLSTFQGSPPKTLGHINMWAQQEIIHITCIQSDTFGKMQLGQQKLFNSFARWPILVFFGKTWNFNIFNIQFEGKKQNNFYILTMWHTFVTKIIDN